MLKITHSLKGQNANIGLTVSGDYIDAGPIFSLSTTTKKTNNYMLTNRNRKEYLDAVIITIQKPAIFIEHGKKMYHRLLIKMLLYHLNLMDFEPAIASVWGLKLLPMLPHYDFKMSKIKITSYGEHGEKTLNNCLHIVKRTRDGYYNLTALLASAKQDGRTKRTTTTLTKNRTMLYKRLYAAQNNQNDVIKLFSSISATNENADELTNNKDCLISMFVNTNINNETWVDPITFITSMMDCYTDSMILIKELFENSMFGGDIADRHVDSSVHEFVFVSDEQKHNAANQLKADWIKISESEKKYKNERRAIEKDAKLLGINKNTLNPNCDKH